MKQSNLLSVIVIFLMAVMGGIPARGAEQLTVSLITCWPGSEVYELYGHSALRIRGTEADGTPFDSVWNYGMYNYAEPNFVGRFVKGELMYHVGGYPFAWFMPGYIQSGRHVEEQILNLEPAQSSALRRSLQQNSLPQNATYLYDYVKDNCSTRVWERIDSAAGGISLPHQQRYASYREAMRAFHSHYPWYSMGIDIALAYPVDTLISGKDELFLPLLLHDKLARGRLSDGRKAVKATEVLNQGLPDATLAPTAWYATPLFAGWLFFAATLGYCLLSHRRWRLLNWLEAVYFGIAGIAGCIVAYLVFISIHRAASPNLLLIWLNPLDILVPALIWSRRTRPVAVAYMTAQAIALLLVALMWPFQTQCGNPAFIPLILSDMLLAIAYVWLYMKMRRLP